MVLGFFKKKGSEKAVPITEPKRTILGTPEPTKQSTLPAEEDLDQAQAFGESRKERAEDKKEGRKQIEFVTTQEEIDELIDDILIKHHTSNEQLHELQKLRTRHKMDMTEEATEQLNVQIEVHREAIKKQRSGTHARAEKVKTKLRGETPTPSGGTDYNPRFNARIAVTAKRNK